MKIQSQDLAKELDKIYSDSLFASKFLPEGINRTQGAFLSHLCSLAAPQSILEVGGGPGLSCIWIENGVINKKHTHIVLDLGLEVHSKTLSKKIVKSFFPHVKFIYGHSQYLLAKISQDEKTQFDFVFHDADQRFDGIMTDVFFIDKCIKNNGYLIFRNGWNPSIRKSVNFLIKNLGYCLYDKSFLNTLLRLNVNFLSYSVLRYYARKNQDFIILRKEAKKERNWKHFSDF